MGASANSKNKYQEHLIRSILQKRKNSIDNASKTNLYSTRELTDIMTWYDQVTDFVYSNPPTGFVKNIIITENGREDVVAVNYHYFTAIDVIEDAEFVIIFDASNQKQ